MPPKKTILKPCASGQERNPATNRCRKTCKTGTKRNPKGRCVSDKEKKVTPALNADQSKLSDYYPVSHVRRTYKRKPPAKPSVQTRLEQYFKG